MADAASMNGSEYQAVLREHARLGKLMVPFSAMRQALDDAEGARELLADPDMADDGQRRDRRH